MPAARHRRQRKTDGKGLAAGRSATSQPSSSRAPNSTRSHGVGETRKVSSVPSGVRRDAELSIAAPLSGRLDGAPGLG
jgi:hypothetical protein